MIRFAADENFNNDLLRALLRRNPRLNMVRVQDTEVLGASDPDLLEWTAKEQRVLLTHDVQTLPNYAYQRVKAGLLMSGVIEVNPTTPLGEALEDLLILIEATNDDEWEGQIKFIPLR